MKKKSALKFIISIIVILISAYVLAFGINLGNYKILSLGESLKPGLDLKGGVYIEEEIVGGKVSKETLQRTKELLELRVNGLGVSESVVAITGDNRIRIEIPGIYDSQKALEQVGKTGKLKFTSPDGKEVLAGTDVKNATVGVDNQSNKPVVQLQLTKEGTKKFADATKKYINKQISIYMDEDIISSPTVQSEITNGEAIITGSADVEEAGRLAGLIKSGSLPVKLKPATVKTIGPSLGAEAIPTSMTAAAIGIGLIVLFMIGYYRIQGAVASIALVVYIILTLLVFVNIGATLTLPGIAGLLLSVGMAVDANVLIFERTKEELRLGKSLSTSIDIGFKRALSSILDSNITTLIAGFSLYYLGSGSVKGFALTLNIGVICSMFTAVIVTRFLLKSFVNAGWVKNPRLYSRK
ncbi:protein translocase subunit SecD [Clostridium cylindrosporum]|uniref:Protein translocase subunit SecD n=1 Tax=Clostridium cylindrosporum DSM 605 TaxID=1121307 RepID=A0A0J8DAC7_CLOCY|nr:protein translocase subunit SecD [Clostridium cylindrosporum]KMT21269.1 protein translocase subunit SecD [Clostridium cylindrosporum DSM 605]